MDLMGRLLRFLDDEGTLFFGGIFGRKALEGAGVTAYGAAGLLLSQRSANSLTGILETFMELKLFLNFIVSPIFRNSAKRYSTLLYWRRDSQKSLQAYCHS
jgi:hypothetical protein